MSTDATLTSKGQTTIPKQIRDSLRMKTGDRMTFTLLPDGTVLMRVKNKSAMSVAGRLHKRVGSRFRSKNSRADDWTEYQRPRAVPGA